MPAIMHIGDITHLSKAAEFDLADTTRHLPWGVDAHEIHTLSNVLRAHRVHGA